MGLGSKIKDFVGSSYDKLSWASYDPKTFKNVGSTYGSYGKKRFEEHNKAYLKDLRDKDNAKQAKIAAENQVILEKLKKLNPTLISKLDDLGKKLKTSPESENVIINILNLDKAYLDKNYVEVASVTDLDDLICEVYMNVNDGKLATFDEGSLDRLNKVIPHLRDDYKLLIKVREDDGDFNPTQLKDAKFNMDLLNKSDF